MYSNVLFSASRRGDQVAYATEHFQDLQGLRFAPLWTAWLLLSACSSPFRLSQRHLVEINMLILLAFCTAWLPWISRWYRLRYGTVVHTPSRSGTRRLYLLMLFLLLLPATFLVRGLDVYQPYLNFWPVYFLLILSNTKPHSGSLAIRLRFLLRVAAMLSFLALIGCAPLLDLSVQAVRVSFCATLLTISFYDHWLLKHLLNGAHGSFL